MGGRGGSGRSSAAVPTTLTPEMQLRMAYDAAGQLVNEASRNQNQGPWVALTSLRPRLAAMGMSREQQDAELLRAVRSRKAVLASILYQVHKNQEDRDTELMMGGMPHHYISFY